MLRHLWIAVHAPLHDEPRLDAKKAQIVVKPHPDKIVKPVYPGWSQRPFHLEHEIAGARLKFGAKAGWREFNQSTQHLRQRNTFIEAFCG